MRRNLSAASVVPGEPGGHFKSFLFDLFREAPSHGGLNASSEELPVTHSEGYHRINVNGEKNEKYNQCNAHKHSISYSPFIAYIALISIFYNRIIYIQFTI